MKKTLASALLLLGTLMLISSTIPSCKSKVKDTDIQSSVEANLRGNPDLSGVTVTVNDGVATLSGEVRDAATKAAAESALAGVKGLKSVSNNITIAAPPAPPVEITADDPLKASVTDAIKDHPGVSAVVNDGVITLTGEIKRSDLTVLMQKLNALKPKKIDNKLTVK